MYWTILDKYVLSGRCTAAGGTNRAAEGHNRGAGIVQICCIDLQCFHNRLQSCLSFFSCSSQLSSHSGSYYTNRYKYIGTKFILSLISPHTSIPIAMTTTILSRNRAGGNSATEVKWGRGEKSRVKITCTLHNLSQCVKQKISFLSPHGFSNKYSQHKHNHLHLPTCFLCTRSCAHELPHALGAAANKDIRDCTCNVTAKGGNK